ncbi:MAG: hypothetical protein ABIN91_20570 [Mucilaginibacter sp.]|uniref:hypothetical protein n=1 Tax=Mucilaginibacter sp. TaxID=1882438 RepID=UPI0032679082
MKPVYKLLTACLFVLASSNVYAQADTSDNQASFQIGINFINNNVYLGRPDSVSTPSISPKIKYTFKSGLYFSGEVNYITNKKSSKLDGGNIEAGYDYTTPENFEAGASITKLFYNATSTQVSSALSTIVNAYADYDIVGIVTPGISASYIFNKSGNKNDILFNLHISHEFEFESIFGDDDDLTITPQAGLNAGSQNFYAGYQERKGKLNRKANAAITAYDNQLGDFKLLNYELSAPLEYATGRFVFNFTPTYAFTQNSLPQSTLAEQAITKALENASPYKPSIFYFEVGVSLKF